MPSRASGTFEAKVRPLPPDEQVDGLNLGRMAFDKQFVGDLEATSRGEMMSVETSVKGSRGYVAIERVDGALHGRAGTFVVLHQGTMRRSSDFTLMITVVPDSGTGRLVGLEGTIALTVKDGVHSYAFDYALPDTP